MFKRALKYVAAAALLLAPTLAGVAAQAPPAMADSSHTAQDGGGPFHANSSVEYEGGGLTYIDAFAYVLPTGDTHCYDHNPFSFIDKSPWQFTPGATTSVCVAVTTSYDPDFGNGPLDHWKSLSLNVRDFNSNTDLSTTQTWTNPDTFVSGATLPNDTWYSSPISFRFDTNPLNGSSDTNKVGSFELYLSMLEHYDATPADSRGHGSSGEPNYFAQGYMVASPNSGMLFGGTAFGSTNTQKVTDLADQQGSTYGINKNYSLERDYASSWGLPAARVTTWAAQGKVVAWSVKPPGWTGSCGAWSGTCPSGGVSPWANASADINGVNGLKAQVQVLQNDANVTGGPAFVTWSISHEPHDNAIDTSQGWNGGGSGRGCGSASDPSVEKTSGKGDYCLGTAAEYKALYAQMRYERDHDCNASGGTTAPLGSPCSKVKIQYIGVPSNMTPKGSGSVGDGDPMRPASTDYDILGVDPYNWGCLRKDNTPIVDTHGTTTSGSTALSTSTSNFFKSGDVGKLIGGTNIPAGTVVASFTNGTHVTLSQAATGTASGSATINMYRNACDDGTTAGHVANNEWKSVAQLIDDPAASTGTDGRRTTFLGLADRFDKPVIIDEIGSAAGCDGTQTTEGCNGAYTRWQDSSYPQNGRGEWFVEGLRAFEQNTLSVRYIIGFAYFTTNGSVYDWRFIPTSVNPSPDTEGFTEFKQGSGWPAGNGVADSYWLSTAASYTFQPTP